MDNFFLACLDRFEALHNDIKKSIRGLDRDAYDWIPASETNSISVLVTHLAAAEKFWAVDIALGKDSDRERAEEFLAGNLSEDDLVLKLDSALDYIGSAFEEMELADIEKMRHPEQRNMDVTAGWAILHALEHTAMHVGHIQITAQLWLGRGTS